jgi:hypothetical protein
MWAMKTIMGDVGDGKMWAMGDGRWAMAGDDGTGEGWMDGGGNCLSASLGAVFVR